MRLTPYFQIERQQALEEGVQQGVQQEAINLVLRLLTRKLGEFPVDLRDKVNQLSVEELENLAVDLLGFESVSDLEIWLN